MPAGAQTKGSGAGLESYEAMVTWSLHQANLDQLEMAKLAESNASSPAVKSFADRLREDHQAAETQVESYAQGRGVDLADLGRRVTGMTRDQLELERRVKGVGSAAGEWAWSWEQAMRPSRTTGPELANLRKLKGADFDREFVKAEQAQHKEIVDRLGDARTRTNDTGLKGVIDAVLPACQQHLATAQQLQTRVSKAP
jgi:putative membrane protein